VSEDRLRTSLRDSLHELGERPLPGFAVDPVALRRRGDARRAGRRAAGAALASSMVIVAGLGSVYYAAHRTRPATPAHDAIPPGLAPPAARSPVSVALVQDGDRVRVAAGVEARLQFHLVGTTAGRLGHIDYGDGQMTGGSVTCAPAQTLTHEWARPGTYRLLVQPVRGCEASATETGAPLAPATITVEAVPAPEATGSTATGAPGH